MRLKFDPNQDYQLEAINAVVDLFEELAPTSSASGYEGIDWKAIPNRLDLDEEVILRNLQAVQERNELPQDDKLIYPETEDGEHAYPNFTVEMETGTGKTYVYLRTILELNRRYGLKKFIIVVPYVAVREGVLKSLQITQRHFQEQYDNVPYRFGAYDSKNRSQVRQFALSDAIEIMVMTIQSFTNKDTNVVYQSHDQLQGDVPIDLIKATRPVLILDEPQNFKSAKRKDALAELNPLFALRYSATHAERFNLVHRLTPYDAYRLRLVKQIEVAGIEERDSYAMPFVRLEGVAAKKKTLTAKMRVHTLTASGTINEKAVTFKPGECLEKKTKLPDYRDLTIEEMSTDGEWVRFTNGKEISKGHEFGKDKDALFEAQIAYTIEEHFRKQTRFNREGRDVKVLSLFFIDQVDNYAWSGQDDKPVIREIFDRCYNRIKAGYEAFKDTNPEDVQAAYFANRTTREGEVIYEDSKTGENEKDKAVYDLIMKDKETLLSFPSEDDSDEEQARKRVCFIFSHSALREGWDNPNVFQICTLNQTASTMKKRQEIGRGLRLAVNQDGERVKEEAVNVLTVIANQSYKSYVENLQSEYDEATGREQAPPAKDARTKKPVKLRKEMLLSDDFKELWNRIAQKTRYNVTIDTERLIADTVKEIDRETIAAPKLSVEKVKVRLDKDEDLFTPMRQTGAKTLMDLSDRYPLPNLVEVMAELLERSSPPVRVTKRTMLELFRRTRRKQEAANNPHVFATIAIRHLKEQLAEQLVDGIRYERLNEWWEMTEFKDMPDTWEEYLVESHNGRSVYDHVIYDSDIEREFAKSLENDERVKLYVKLPGWFTVPTPVGQYNPDWAIVVEETDEFGEVTEKKLYLVRETKGTEIKSKLRPDERRKVTCGERHFKDTLSVDYKVVTSFNGEH